MEDDLWNSEVSDSHTFVDVLMQYINGGNILQWNIDSKHGLNQQQHHRITLSTLMHSLFLSLWD